MLRTRHSHDCPDDFMKRRDLAFQTGSRDYRKVFGETGLRACIPHYGWLYFFCLVFSIT